MYRVPACLCAQVSRKHIDDAFGPSLVVGPTSEGGGRRSFLSRNNFPLFHQKSRQPCESVTTCRCCRCLFAPLPTNKFIVRIRRTYSGVLRTGLEVIAICVTESLHRPSPFGCKGESPPGFLFASLLTCTHAMAAAWLRGPFARVCAYRTFYASSLVLSPQWRTLASLVRLYTGAFWRFVAFLYSCITGSCQKQKATAEYGA